MGVVQDLPFNAIKELLADEYYCVIDKSNEELVGYFCMGKSAQVPAGFPFGAYPEGFVDIGIGMKPELTGRGNGSIFFSFILRYIYRNAHSPLRLTVATFNHRAIHLYEKFGFVSKMKFLNNSIGFITMIKE
ncbi:GNAT family N-acetyltransferase [Virgibacillus sp. NKC19-3]|uniref:GNAT family N-acetyltransferase n=1 Tax=Virgibacillus saliphilus TaxID=2831674 RepID=UPI001C9BA287|nr:GNAT family N-acetyltransferase [Virgibacillus sp. NKC19-3]MBY7142623.1 GNAT family N-acetyltransferase [Virgibacillus sp. NKC19-3]